MLQRISKILRPLAFILHPSKAFGLDISDYSIEAISLGGSFGAPRLLAMGRRILEPGVIENGEILNKERLVSSLKDLIKNPEFGKIKTKNLIFSIPEPRSFIHIFELPKNLKREEEFGFVSSQAEKILPYPLKDLYLDFEVRQREVLLVAAPKMIVDRFLEVFKICGLSPVALESESESLARSLILNPKEAVLIADIGAKATNFSVFDKEGLRLSITIEAAGDRFTQALSEGLKISAAAAESLKKEIGLNPQPQKGKVFLILQKEIQEIIQEIVKINNYFREKEGEDIKKIILTGGSVTLPLLPEYLAENLEIPVALGDPWVKINIDILKKEEYFEQAQRVNPILYATCLGSALRSLSKNCRKAGINLIK